MSENIALLFHVNIRKMLAASNRISENLKDIGNAIVSVNETTLKVNNIESFHPPLFCADALRRTRAAIYIKGEKFKGILIARLSTPDIAVVNITGNGLDVVIISAYLPPNEDYDRSIHELDFAIKNLKEKKIIVCSDTNSRSPFWGDTELNKRGESLESFCASNDLRILNTDSEVTFFNKQGSKSKIDLILANDLALDYRPRAEVLTVHTGSDHKMIKVDLELKRTSHKGPFRNTTRIYRTDKANWELFEEKLDTYEHIITQTNFAAKSKDEADLAVCKLNEYLKKACDESIPKLKHRRKRKENENDEIERLTKLEELLNSKYNKLVKSNQFEAILVLKELGETTKLKTAEQLKHRNTCMEKKFTSLNSTNDPNEAFKIHKTFKARLNRSCPSTIVDLNGKSSTNSQETTSWLFNHCFPDKNHPIVQDKIIEKDQHKPVLISSLEISSCVKWMANNKAPGIDGFTPIIIKKALHKIVLPLTDLLNALLRLGYFPDAWKEGFAIFIPKTNQEKKTKTKTVKDFRPITLLNVLAKLFERLLIGRINKFLLSNNKLNPRQDGFSKQRSTIHSLHSFRNFAMKNAKNNRSTVAIFLDISGAFDNACWQLIIESLKRKDCPNYLTNLIISYFQNRNILTNSQNSKLEKRLSQGAPQGSCCGPSLWNVLLDTIFDIPHLKDKLNRDDFYIKAFADDICICFTIKNESKQPSYMRNLEKEIESTLNAIFSWGVSNYLEFNVKKTKAIVFKSSAYTKLPKITMNRQTISPEKLVKYLGIWFDDRLDFTEHATKTIDKCKKIFNIVRSYCGNTWGLNSYLTRLIYKTIIIPVLTYGASIWYPAFMNLDISKKTRTLQYYCTKSIVKSYRTASIVSTSLLSNTLPLESETYMRAQIELARVTGAIQKDIFMGTLVSNQSYKPLYFHQSLLDTFSSEENVISVRQLDTFTFGDPNNLSVEPVVKWADLPVGPEMASLYCTEDFTKVKAEHDYYLFTDGSRTDNGTGGGFVIKARDTLTIESQALPMNPLCTVFQSEMFSIYESLSWTLKNLDLKDKKILVCSDSLSALQKLKSSNNDHLLSFFINHTLNRIASQSCKVYFAKVPAHKEERLTEIDENSDEAFFIRGNIDADFMAKLAAGVSSDRENTKPTYNYIPLSTVKRHIKAQLKNAWLAKSYDPDFTDDRAQLNNWIKNFIPNGDFINKRALALCDYYTSQIVIGHGCFKAYFKRFKIMDDDCCLICKDKSDSPEHILFECNSKYTSALRKMKIKQPKDLSKILKSNETIAEFKNLCKVIVTDRLNLLNSCSTATQANLPLPKMKSVRFKNEPPEVTPTETLSSIKKTGTGRRNPPSNRAPKEKEKRTHLISAKHGITKTSWLNDEHIYKFAQKHHSNCKNQKTLIMPCPVYQNDIHTAGFLMRYMSISVHTILAIILVNNNHWILGSINVKKKKIAIFDSTRNNQSHECTFKRLYLIAELSLFAMGRCCKFEDFEFCCSNETPTQTNNDDCGVFVCRFIKNILTGNSRKFTIKTGDYRKEIVNILDNDWQITEPTNSTRLNKKPTDRLRSEGFPEYVNNLQIAHTYKSYNTLVKLFI